MLHMGRSMCSVYILTAVELAFAMQSLPEEYAFLNQDELKHIIKN